MKKKGLLSSAVGAIMSAEVEFAGGWLWGTFKLMFLVTLSFLIYCYFWVSPEMAGAGWFPNFCVNIQPYLATWWVWLVVPLIVALITAMLVGGMVLQIGCWILRGAIHKVT
jgi:hypothetical protein